MRSYHRRLIQLLAVVLCAALLCPAVSRGLAAGAEDVPATGDLRIATLSDLRYYPDALAGDKGEAYYSYLGAAGVNGRDQDALLDAAFASLEAQARQDKLDYLVICGNLTAGGEYAGADAVARRLRLFSLQSGVRVFVLNGDRDINNPGASDFSTNRKQPSANVSPAQFLELFGDFGYLSAHHVYKILGSGTQGSLTYSVKLPEGYRLIMADICRYTADCTSSHRDVGEEAAGFSGEQLQWVLTEAEDARKNGETPLLFTHAGVVPVNAFQEKLRPGTLAEDAYLLRDALADAGVLCAFSGAAGASDTDVYYSDGGNPLYAVSSPSVTRFPFGYRITSFDFDYSGNAEISFDWHDCDETAEVRADSGNVYPSPYRAIGFVRQFGARDPEKYFCAVAREKLDGLCADIVAAGGVVAYVERLFGVDVREAVYSSVGDGIRFGPITLLSASHVMSAVEDLDASLMERYVRRPSRLYDAADRAVRAFLALPASDVPCTRYLDTYGFGDAKRGGTVGELALDLIATFLSGNERTDGDAFLQDALSEKSMAALTARLVDAFRTYVVDDIFVNEILANTEFRVRTLFTASSEPITEYTELIFSAALSVLGSRLLSAQDGQQAWSAFSRLATDGEAVSVGSVIDLLLDAGNNESGRTVDAFLDTVFSLLCGEEQQAAMADSLSSLLKSLVTDATPDTGVTLSYRGAVAPPADEAGMRLPSMVQLSVNSNTSFTVTWFTKHTVTGTDMEIVKEGSPFTGVPTKSAFIASDTAETTLNGFGFDCGNYGFLPYAVKAVRHVITVRGLSANTKLRFRIGDAAKGFWKECSFETGASDGSSAYTFLHIADSDGVTASSARAFASALRTANRELAPSFIVHSGNLVRYPWNDAQWARALDGAADVFSGVPLMYASGVNDGDGYYSVQKHMTYSRTPAQYQEAGVYYSFDYGRAHFTVLNTNSLQADGTLSARQEEWLKNDLAGAVGGWKILVLYSPVFCVENTNLKLEAQLRGIVSGNRVDLVLQGGGGGYARSSLLMDGAPTDAYTVSSAVSGGFTYPVMEATGAYVVTTAAPFTGSEPLREVRSAVTAVAQDFSVPVFSAVTVDGDTLFVSAYAVEGEGALNRVDFFALRKNSVQFLLGDADMDGEVTPEDARLTLRVAVGLDIVTPITKAAADMDGDVYVSPEDARLVLRTSVGLEQPPRTVSRFVYEIAAYKDA